MEPKKYKIENVFKVVLKSGLCYGEYKTEKEAKERIAYLTEMQTITLKDGTQKEIPARDYDAGYVSRCCGERMYMIYDTKLMYCVKCEKTQEYIPKW